MWNCGIRKRSANFFEVNPSVLRDWDMKDASTSWQVTLRDMSMSRELLQLCCHILPSRKKVIQNLCIRATKLCSVCCLLQHIFFSHWHRSTVRQGSISNPSTETSSNVRKLAVGGVCLIVLGRTMNLNASVAFGWTIYHLAHNRNVI